LLGFFIAWRVGRFWKRGSAECSVELTRGAICKGSEMSFAEWPLVFFDQVWIEDAREKLAHEHRMALGDGGAPPDLEMAEACQSCRTTVNKDLLTLILPLYSIKPSFLNLFIKKFTRERVVPIISARVSCETFSIKPSF
jgi:hypothetical protein